MQSGCPQVTPLHFMQNPRVLPEPGIRIQCFPQWTHCIVSRSMFVPGDAMMMIPAAFFVALPNIYSSHMKDAVVFGVPPELMLLSPTPLAAVAGTTISPPGIATQRNVAL